MRKVFAAMLAASVAGLSLIGSASSATAQTVPNGCIKIGVQGAACPFDLGGSHIIVGGLILSLPSAVPVPSVGPSALPTLPSVDPTSLLPTVNPTIPSVDPTSLIPPVPTVNPTIPSVDPTALIPPVPTVNPTIPSVDPTALLPTLPPTPGAFAAPRPNGAHAASARAGAQASQADIIQVDIFAVPADGPSTLVASCPGTGSCVKYGGISAKIDVGTPMTCVLKRASQSSLFGCYSF